MHIFYGALKGLLIGIILGGILKGLLGEAAAGLFALTGLAMGIAGAHGKHCAKVKEKSQRNAAAQPKAAAKAEQSQSSGIGSDGENSGFKPAICDMFLLWEKDITDPNVSDEEIRNLLKKDDYDALKSALWMHNEAPDDPRSIKAINITFFRLIHKMANLDAELTDHLCLMAQFVDGHREHLVEAYGGALGMIDQFVSALENEDTHSETAKQRRIAVSDGFMNRANETVRGIKIGKEITFAEAAVRYDWAARLDRDDGYKQFAAGTICIRNAKVQFDRETDRDDADRKWVAHAVSCGLLDLRRAEKLIPPSDETYPEILDAIKLGEDILRRNQ